MTAPSEDLPSPPPSRTSRRRELRLTLFAVGAVLATLVIFFHEPLLGEGHFFFRDAFRIYLPFRMFLYAGLRSGELPLWFPYEAGGVPFFSQLVPGALHPTNLLYLIAPFRKAFQLNHVLPYFIAAIGMFLWARGRGASRIGAIVGALGYALCGSLTSQTNLLYILGNTSVPLALFAADRALDRPSALSLLGCTAAFVLILFGGEPQSLILAGLFVLGDIAARKGWEGRARGVAILGFVALGTALSGAVQLLPALETFLQSDRFDVVDHQRWSFPAARIVELFADDAFGANDGTLFELLYTPSAYPWSPRVFIGPCLLILALIGAGIDRRSRALAIMTLLCLWISLGPSFGLERLFTALVPMWKGFRYPEKLIPFFSLGIALLAALGVDRVRAGIGRWQTALLGGVFAATGLGFAIAQYADVAPGELAPFYDDAVRGCLIAAATAGVVWTLIHFGPRKDPRGNLLASVLALLAIAPPFFANVDAPQYADSETVFMKPWSAQMIEELEPERDFPVRVFSGDRRDRMPLLPEHETLNDSLRHIAMNRLVPDYSAVFGIENFSHYQPAVAPLFRRALQTRVDVLVSRLLPIFGVEYFVVSDPTLEVPNRWEVVREHPDSKVRVLKATQRLERAYVARSAAHATTGEAALELVRNPAFPPADATVIECPLSPEDMQVEDRGSARIVRWDFDRVVLRAEMKRPGFVVLNDSYADGWTAKVDGNASEICRANALVRAVRLEPGTHEVVFEYRPKSFTIGLWLTTGTLAAWLAVIAFLRLRRRSSNLPPPAIEQH